MTNIKVSIIGDPHLKPQSPKSRIDNYQEAILKKMHHILYDIKSDLNIFLGDMFDKPSVSEELLNTLICEFKNSNSSNITCIGNHDLYHDNATLLYRTALGNLSLAKALTILNDNINTVQTKEGSFIIFALPYNFEKAKNYLTELSNYSFSTYKNIIIIGHHFYEFKKCMDHSFTKEFLNSLKFDTNVKMFLGHEHEPHDIITINNIQLYRPGALARTSLDEFTLTHRPSVYTFNLNLETYEITNIELVEVPHEDVNTVFNLSNRVEFKSFKKVMKDAKAFADSISLDTSIDTSISDQLLAMNIDTEAYEYLKTISLNENAPF